MLNIKQIFFILLGVNCLFLLVFFANLQSDTLSTNTNLHVQQQSESVSKKTSKNSRASKHSDSELARDLDSDETDEADETDDDNSDSSSKKSKSSKKSSSKKEKELSEAVKEGLANIKKLEGHLERANKRVMSLLDRRDKVQHVLRWSNPFFLLGAYPKVGLEYFNSYPDGRPYYEKFNYGIINDPDYCEITDFYNLAHPENMFDDKQKFLTDYAKNGLARTLVMRKIGVDTMPQVSRYMDKKAFYSAQYHLNPTITNIFTKRVDIHIYHMIGKNFACATQMYNHIPGHGVLKRKDLIVDSVDEYAQKFANRPHCFNKKKFFPFSYRLYIESECREFFEEINSKAYAKRLKKEPIQYVMKVGYGAHRAMGVFLLDANETELRKAEYQNGERCGLDNKSLIAQTYITNPLLLNLDNKFDFRVYMLVASTNPLIVYYHDGFLRVSLHTYDKNSQDKSVHLTNTHLSKDTFAYAKEHNITFHGMNEQELRDYQMWTFDRLNRYLYEAGKVDDENWADNYLRKEFYKAFIHTARMSHHAFWQESNVYEMFGLDFMLDDELNLWFIECNSSPQLIGTNELKTNFLVKMLNSLFEIQHGLYRSRMKRVMALIKRIQEESLGNGRIEYELYRNEYKDAARNRFEPEYEPSADNSFKLILDENLSGPDAYFGHLDDDCVDY